jgi:hypothetical protein
MQLQQIQHMIYEIRKQKVMLDFDLGELYEAINYLLQKDKRKTEDKERKRIGFLSK